MNFKKIMTAGVTLLSAAVLAACGNSNAEQSSSSEKPEDAPDTWIADRTITILSFGGEGGHPDELQPEIQEYIKDRTGITLELEKITDGDSTEALAAGLAAGDLPDVVGYYLNHSGRPEFPLLLQAANEGMFHDIAPYLKEGETYGKYFEEGYLPTDTRENIMMREEHDGATYLVHMSINEEPADPGMKQVGGPYVRRDIVEDLGVDPLEINTTDQLYELLTDIQEGGYTDDNGNPVTPLGPTVWGGSERPFIYNDLVWQGEGGEKFWKDGDEVLHESRTDYAEQRVAYVRDLMDQGLMHPEFYTMEATRAQEEITNGSFAVVADMYNYRPEIGDLKYIPLGPINRVDGTNHMVLPYKSGYSGWAVPSTTENPEEVVAFADWLASDEGKLLYAYGIEGEHYDLNENGYPVPKEEVVQLAAEDPAAAEELGFRGVGAWWAEPLAWTNINNLDQFGEVNWGDNVSGDSGENKAAQEIIEMYNFDERHENAEIIDGLYPRSYLNEFEGVAGPLNAALDRWEEDIVKAYYATTDEEVADILEAARQELEAAGLAEYEDFLEEKEAEGDVIFY